VLFGLERGLSDIFLLQDEITTAVVCAILPKLLRTEIAAATWRRPENLTAYDFPLRAMSQHSLATRKGLAETIRLANRALELDPRSGFVAALAGLCYTVNVVLGFAADPQFDRKEAVRFLRLASNVDDGGPQTLATAAVVSAFMVGDYESSIEMVDRAVALNPQFILGMARQRLGLSYCWGPGGRTIDSWLAERSLARRSHGT
jgi:adenylate cyclase